MYCKNTNYNQRKYNTSSVEAIMTPNDDIKKFVYDDQLLIIHDGKTYNVMGVEVGE